MKKLLIPFFLIAAATYSYAAGSCCAPKVSTPEKPVAAATETKTETVVKVEKKATSEACAKDCCKKS